MLNLPMLRSLALLAFSMLAIALLGACGPSGGSSDAAPDADVDGVSASFDCDDSDPDVSGRQTYFLDADEDGVGGPDSESICEMDPPRGYSRVSGDCDDANSRIQSTQTFYVDQDRDGVGGSQSAALCVTSAPSGYSGSGGDCNDNDRNVTGGTGYYADRDGDGYGAGAATFLCTSSPPDGMVTNDDDPNDSNDSIVPQDSDGDGYANSNDCARNDPNRYVLNRYYEDEDGDGLGSGEVEICGPLPAPTLSGYVSNDLDGCPQVFDSGRDFDDDGVDDVCDAAIHVGRSMTVTEDIEFPERLAVTGTRIDYRIGENGSAVEVRFQGASLIVDDCVSVQLRGGSTLVFETTRTSSYASLELGSSQGHSSRCQTSIRGQNASNATQLNRLRFLAARLFAGSRARLLDLNEVSFTPARIRNAQNAQVEHGSDLYLMKPSGRNWSADEYLSVSGASRADAALVVEDQFLDLTDVRFIDNDEYPLECIGRDYRLLPGTITHRSRTSRTTCQTAISRSHFDGNRRAGPLLSTLEEYDSDVGAPNIFDRRRNLLSVLFGDPGTNAIYVREMNFSNKTNTNYAVAFNDVDVLPFTDRGALGSGSGDDDFSEDVEIRFGDPSRPGPTVTLTEVDIVDVPIVVLGEARLEFEASKLGPMLIKTDEGPSNAGPRIIIEDSEIDFNGSEFRQFVLGLDRRGRTEIAGIVFDNFGSRPPGVLQIRDSSFKFNNGIDYPILFLSDEDAEDHISIDDDSFPKKNDDFDDVVEEEDNDCCSITTFFGLK